MKIEPTDGIEILDLKTRLVNSLHKAGIETVRDLQEAIKNGEVTQYKGISDYSLWDVESALEGIEYLPCDHEWLLLGTGDASQSTRNLRYSAFGCLKCDKVKKLYY